MPIVPPKAAWDAGYKDGYRKNKKSSNRAGYPDMYDAGYAQGLMERQPWRAWIYAIGIWLQEKAITN